MLDLPGALANDAVALPVRGGLAVHLCLLSADAVRGGHVALVAIFARAFAALAVVHPYGDFLWLASVVVSLSRGESVHG